MIRIAWGIRKILSCDAIQKQVFCEMDFDQTQVIDDFELDEAESEEENEVHSKKIEVSLKKFRRITMHSLSATITSRTF